MKKVKILIPLLGVTSIVGAVAPLASCGGTSQKEEDTKATIKFAAIGGGTITKGSTIEVDIGTKWDDVQKPEFEAYDDYLFMGWFNGNMPMSKNDIVNGDMNITGRFVENNKILPAEFFQYEDFGGGVCGIFGYNGGLHSDTFVVPEQLYTGSEYLTVVVIQDSNPDQVGLLQGVKSLYIPKTVQFVNLRNYPSLTNIWVDPESEYFTSRDKNGNECSCLMETPREDSEGTHQGLEMGTGNSIIPEGVTNILENAFDGAGVREITLPSTLQNIYEYAFRRNNIESISFPKSLIYIGMHAFEECQKLKEMTFETGSQLAYIEYQAFRGCSSLEKIEFPDSLEGIEYGAFINCYNLKSIHLGSKLAYVTRESFENCTALEEIDINSSNEYYASSNGNCIVTKQDMEAQGLIANTLVFGIKTSTIPSGVVAIANDAFAACKDLKEITIPSSVKVIGAGAFSGTGLQSITIPGTVDIVGNSAFYGCIALKQATIEEGVKSLGSTSFAECTQLGSVVLPSTLEDIDQDAPGMGPQVFNGDVALQKAEIKCAKLGVQAFARCRALNNVIVSNNVKTIETQAFEDCISLTSITLPEVKTINASAFAGCNALSNIQMPKVTSIKDYAFANCARLRSITLPKTLESLGACIFYGDYLTNRVVKYDGDKSDWNGITKSLEWHWFDDLGFDYAVYKVSCNDGDIVLE